MKFKKRLDKKSLVFTTSLGSLYKKDCLDLLSNIADESFDLIFADPPYNLGKDYGNESSDSLPNEKYIEWSRIWLSECFRVLKKGGSLFVLNIPKWNIEFSHHLNSIGADFRNWIAVDLKNRMPISGRLYPSHYSLIYYTKGKPKTFNRVRIPIQICRHCGQEIKNYGGYRSKIHSEGISLTDIWYDLSPVRHKNRKNRKSNELPERMLERILALSSNIGDLVFDPFGGSGTTYAVCEKMHRHWLGSEIGDCEPIKVRLTTVV